MTTQDEIITILKEKTPFLATEYGVKRMGVFGSYTKGTFDEESDIDLVIEFDRPIGFAFMRLVDYLEILLGKPIDVLTPSGIQSIRVPEVAQDITKHIVYV